MHIYFTKEQAEGIEKMLPVNKSNDARAQEAVPVAWPTVDQITEVINSECFTVDGGCDAYVDGANVAAERIAALYASPVPPAKLRCEMCAGSKWKDACPECDGTGWYTPDAPPAASAEAVREQTVDAFVTALYRRFKGWSKRGFGPDDVTWCEVKADVKGLLQFAALTSTKGLNK